MNISGTVTGAAVGALLAVAPAAADVIGEGELQVEINRYGVPVGVPAAGLTTVDGPPMVFRDGFRAWYGVAFHVDGRRVDGCGPGAAPDWGDRTLVEFVSFESTPQRATAVASLGDLEIRTELWTVEGGRYIVGDVTLTNTGEAMMQGVLYTREGSAGRPGARGWTFPYDIPGLPDAPSDLMRHVWMLDGLRPGASGAVGFSHALPGRVRPGAGGAEAAGVDVPLSLWTHPDFPSGVPVGATNGISWGDYDADGFIDMFACQSANLWRNVNGTTWEFAADLDTVLPSTPRRYGSSFGDYDNDGLPDIGTEPREGFGGDECIHLLHNLGGGPNFEDVATDPEIMDVQACKSDAETICWGDVDDDGDLDMFFPVYPAWAAGSGPGNFFYNNLGPVGPGGAYALMEFSEAGGFDNPPPDSARPEGAQFVDVDFDGDMDLYSNGTLYQNNSPKGVPSMDWMTETGSGILYHNRLEEGAALGDYDLDGDFDLFIVYTTTSLGVRIFENEGDGTFFDVEDGVIESRTIGLNLGLSAEDWDNDGDIDFTTRQVFRRNMLVETGVRRFDVATTSIPGSHITSATPAWGDWDKDGDLDCALGNWLSTGHFYENTTYDESTPFEDRRYVRVRPLENSLSVPAGLETAYATSVEVCVAGEEDGPRRKKFTSSAGGYLNQNEYTLTFAMPPAPLTGEDVRFDVIADFPSLPAEGLWRVDRHVNSALGDIGLADLANREIVVFRSGVVVIDGVTYPPRAAESPRLTTAVGGLAGPDPKSGLAAPDPTGGNDDFVGVDFDTVGAARRVRIREIIVDGELGAAVACGDEQGSILLWDVTTPGAPVLRSDAALDVASSSRNDRSYYTTDVVLERDRRYRLVARAVRERDTPVSLPFAHENLTVNGGLLYEDLAPCTGATMEDAAVDDARVYLSFRFGAVGGDADIDGDGVVATSDLLIVLATWGDCPDPPEACPGDLDGDGMVGTSDLLIVLASWS